MMQAAARRLPCVIGTARPEWFSRSDAMCTTKAFEYLVRAMKYVDATLLLGVPAFA